MYCDVFSGHDTDNEYEEFKEKLSKLNSNLFKKLNTQINTYKEHILHLKTKKNQLIEKLRVPESQSLKIKELNQTCDQLFNKKSIIINEIND